MWAAAKGDLETIKFLIEKGAKIDHEDNDGLNAFDLCVTKILYQPALLFYQEYGQRQKTIEFYRKHVISQEFDFELFFEFLELGRP